MSLWVNRTVGQGPNGSTTRTYNFTAATAGNFLLAVVAAQVTSTTPTGWTVVKSFVGADGVYIFGKTATAGESSFTITHNGDGTYTTQYAVYEFPAGTALNGTPAAAAATAVGNNGQTCTGLTGTYTRMAVFATPLTNSANTVSSVWSVPTVKDVDSTLVSTSHGMNFTIAYDDNQTAASFTAARTMSVTAGNTTTSESAVWALTVPTPGPTAATSTTSTTSAAGGISSSRTAATTATATSAATGSAGISQTAADATATASTSASGAVGGTGTAASASQITTSATGIIGGSNGASSTTTATTSATGTLTTSSDAGTATTAVAGATGAVGVAATAATTTAASTSAVGIAVSGFAGTANSSAAASSIASGRTTVLTAGGATTTAATSASGSVRLSGSAALTVTFTTAAAGTKAGAARDITVAITVGADRWAVTTTKG